MQLASVSINCFIKTSVCILLVPQISWVINITHMYLHTLISRIVGHL